MDTSTKLGEPRVVTLVSKYDGISITQKEGREKRSRLWCQAPGLDIYLIGAVNKRSFDRINHMAMTMAQSMNIPLISLHYAKANTDEHETHSAELGIRHGRLF